MTGKLVFNNSLCTILLVYGGVNENHRETIYSEIKCSLQNLTNPILLLGDFNEILEVNERKGHDKVTREMKAYKSWIDFFSLIDLPTSRRKYTWKRENSKSRLHRVMCDPLWLSEFPWHKCFRNIQCYL